MAARFERRRMIEFSTVPAKDGFEWVRISLKLVRAQWLRYTALAALFLLITFLTAVLSAGFLTALLKPILSVGFLAAAWHHERGGVPEVKHLFAGFKSNLKDLLLLGFVYALGVFLVRFLATSVTGVSLNVLASEGQAVKPEQAIEVLQYLLCTILFSLPVNAVLWFAPALVVFSDVSFGQALMLSLRAWTRNVLAMTLYMTSFFGLTMLLVLATLPIGLLVGQELPTFALLLFAVPLAAVFMVGDYVSYRRIFHRNERLTDLPLK